MLYKSRSFSSCILAAYQLMSKNLRNILKATWLPVLIYVFILASFLLINLPNEEVVALGIAHFALYIGVLASCLLGLIVTGIWALSRLMSILNEEPRRWNFMRAVWLTLNSIVITLVITAVVVAVAKLAGGYLAPYMQNHFWLFLCMAFFIVLMAVVLLLPLNYVFMKYLNERDMRFWHDFLPSYRIGLRRTSFIFITLFNILFTKDKFANQIITHMFFCTRNVVAYLLIGQMFIKKHSQSPAVFLVGFFSNIYSLTDRNVH